MGRKVYAYELLFREEADAAHAPRCDASATASVIISTFSDFGLADIVEDKLCFVNVTRHFLVGELPLPFRPEQTVLEILETVPVDDAVLEGVARLAAQGYRIALDDYILGSRHEQLLPMASVVKLDLLNTPLDDLRATAALCAAYPGITLLAEKVESEEHLALARDLGCQLFQGYALSRPTVVSGPALSPGRRRQLELLHSLRRADVDMEQVISLISRDPALSLRVLRVSNSADAGLPQRVSSLRQAVMLLGIQRIREWVELMALDSIADQAQAEQLDEAVVRARMCQQLAERAGLDGELAFTAGLLLGIADLLGTPVADILAGLPVSDELAAALLGGRGRMAALLRAVRAYERADLDEARHADLPPEWLVQSYLSAAVWSNQTLGPVLRPCGRAPPAADPGVGRALGRRPLRMLPGWER